MQKKNHIQILPKVEEVQPVTIRYETYQYMQDGEEVKDIETRHSIAVDVPILDYLTWLEFCIALAQKGVEFKYSYMKKVIPHDPDHPHHEWDYFNRIEGNRLFNKDLYKYHSEMLLYYLKDLDYYILIRLDSHRGLLI